MSAGLVLHVEDSRTCRRMLRARLRFPPCSCRVAQAPTLRRARRLLARIPPERWELVVLDLDLAGERGSELLPLLRGTRVVLVTASDQDEFPEIPTIRKGVGWIARVCDAILEGRR